MENQEMTLKQRLSQKWEDFMLWKFTYWVKDARVALKAPFIFIENVWWFRKQLWKFRTWDYMYNLQMFVRSLEKTANFLESGHALAEGADKAAADIRKFIHLIEVSEDPYTEAEKITGLDFLKLHQDAIKNADGEVVWFVWGPEENWTPEQREYDRYSKIVKQLEERSWKNAWKLISRKGQHWWD